LLIKLHPRCRDEGVCRDVVREFPRLHWRIVRRGGMTTWLQRARCVINCTSSAGVEAARLGVPVIELVPRGASDLLPAREWGGCATARDADELESLLRRALVGDLLAPPAGSQDVFASVGKEAAGRMVDDLTEIVAQPSTLTTPTPKFLAIAEQQGNCGLRIADCGLRGGADEGIEDRPVQGLRPLPPHPSRLAPPDFERLCQKPDHRVIGNWMARRVTRPLALKVTRLVAPLGVSAHAATFFAWGAGLAAAFAFAGGTPLFWVVGATLLQLWYLLDHVDGQLARLRGTESLDGAALDYLMHHTLNLLVPIGIGWGFGSRGSLLAGLSWGLGLFAIGLLHDVRYKAFIKRLKRLHGELRAIGGGGGRPAPPAPMPRRPKTLAGWLARKACETHVIMNVLTLLAIGEWLIGDATLVTGRAYLLIMAALAPSLAAMLLCRSLRQGSAEQEFAAWFQAPDQCEVVRADGWYIVREISETTSPGPPHVDRSAHRHRRPAV
jgi:hypothetical protein